LRTDSQRPTGSGGQPGHRACGNARAHSLDRRFTSIACRSGAPFDVSWHKLRCSVGACRRLPTITENQAHYGSIRPIVRSKGSLMMAISTRAGSGCWSGMVAAAALLCLSGCASVRSDYDRSASFANFHTYAIMPRPHQDDSPILVTRIQEAITRELGRRGFRPAVDAGSADFVVDFSLGYKERTDLKSYPDPYGTLNWGWGSDGGWWGG